MSSNLRVLVTGAGGFIDITWSVFSETSDTGSGDLTSSIRSTVGAMRTSFIYWICVVAERFESYQKVDEVYALAADMGAWDLSPVMTQILLRIGEEDALGSTAKTEFREGLRRTIVW